VNVYSKTPYSIGQREIDLDLKYNITATLPMYN